MSKFSCGIDFGTTNTSAAVSDLVSAPRLIEVEGNSPTIPSALFFNASDNHITFGREAMQNYMLGEQGRFMRSLKRVLGTSLMNVSTQINDRPMHFENIISYFIKYIKNKIELQTQAEVENVVMGRPVHFRDNDEKGDLQAEAELKKIAQNAGFKNIEFQYEPIAAAFAHENLIHGEKLACVVDIGGGTSDFTIIRLGQNLISKGDRKDDILASTGVRIGGNDFDRSLSLKSFMPELGMGSLCHNRIRPNETMIVPNAPYFDLSEWSSINSLYTNAVRAEITKTYQQSLDKIKFGRLLDVLEREQGHKLLNLVEENKITLTNDDKSKIKLDFISKHPQVSTSRQEFEEAIQRCVETVSNAIKECVTQAKINAMDVDLIVLTGGSTEIPYVKQVLCSHFPQAEISQENKLSSVGLGLAFDSCRRF